MPFADKKAVLDACLTAAIAYGCETCLGGQLTERGATDCALYPCTEVSVRCESNNLYGFMSHMELNYPSFEKFILKKTMGLFEPYDSSPGAGRPSETSTIELCQNANTKWI